MRRLLLFLFFSRMALAQTVGTPAFKEGTGTYINSVLEVMTDTTAGTRFCYTLDGSTPTATVAGTCDVNGSIYSSTGAYAAIATSGTTLKVIGTKSGLTNSAVASATYTITAKPVANPVGYTTPVNITRAGANIVDELPYLMKAPNGNLFVFYSESTNGGTIDGGAAARVMFKKSVNGGASWTSPTSVSCQGGDPATGCFYDTDVTFGSIPVGGGTTYNNTMLIFISSWGPPNTSTVEGVAVMRSTDNGATWTAPHLITTPSYAANKFANPTVNLISIPPASAGVTGPCAAGCIMTLPLVYPGSTGPIFSYNDGLTWTDPVVMYPPLSWPGEAEERAIIWPGGMNLIMFERGAVGSSINYGWPEPMLVLSSTNLGTSWNTWSNAGATVKGGLSNLPLPTCVVSPSVNIWGDFITRPSVVIDPQNSALATMLYGERLQCNSVAAFRWNIVTFNIGTAFTNAGMDLPLPQILNLDPVVTTQPHTTYSYMVPFGSNTLLMAYEQGNTTSTEDIYTTILSYVNLGTSGVSSAQGTKK